MPESNRYATRRGRLRAVPRLRELPPLVTAPARAESDFAEEAGPKATEFGNREDAEAITAGEFERIP
jgi:hypothetical protein